MDQYFDDIINTLADIRDTTLYDCIIPNTDVNLKLKQLNTEQFNKILKTHVTNSAIYEDRFMSVVDDILQQNIVGDTEKYYDLTIYSRLYLVLKMRQQCISDTVNIALTEEEIEEYEFTENKIKISLEEHFKQKSGVMPIPPLNATIDGIVVTCCMPTIYTDDILERYMDTLVSSDVSTLIEEFFVKEIAKYVCEVKIGEKVVFFKDITVEQRMQLIKQLPAKVINEVIVNIEKLKAPILDLLNITITIKAKDGKIHDLIKEIRVDSELFN